MAVGQKGCKAEDEGFRPSECNEYLIKEILLSSLQYLVVKAPFECFSLSYWSTLARQPSVKDWKPF
jgi:hypothetical protein